MSRVYKFSSARFCHDSVAVSANSIEKASKSTVDIKCGPDMPLNPIAQSLYPHHFDSRDDGRINTSVEFSLSETFQCLEDARNSGHIDSNDYPLVLKEAQLLYAQLQ